MLGVEVNTVSFMCILYRCRYLGFYSLKMLGLVFLPFSLFGCGLRQGHLFEYLLSLVLCMIDIHDVISRSSGDLMSQSSEGRSLEMVSRQELRFLGAGRAGL